MPEDELSFSQIALRHVDAMREGFLKEWQVGNRPRIESSLVEFPEAERPRLLKELLAVELEQRLKHVEHPTLEEYIARFPEYSDLLESDFRELLDSVNQGIAPTRAYDADHQTPDGARGKQAETGAFGRKTPASVGRYQLKEQVGQGGFGQVWRGFDPELERTVAVKVARPDRIDDDLIQQFMNEGRKLAKLDFPGIVPVYDVGYDSGLCFIVAKFVEGGTLDDLLAEARPAFRESARLVADIAETLHYAHLSNYVHRDIKPANILIGRDNKPVVADFGLAISEGEQSSEGWTCQGTYRYMSPEQARGESDRVDARADIYSLGVTFYQLLTGRLPFVAETSKEYLSQMLTRHPRPLRTIDDTVPKELERICLQCLSREVTDRYTTAADLMEDLRNWLVITDAQSTGATTDGGLPSVTSAISEIERPPPREIWSTARIATLVALAVCVCCL